MAPCRTAVRAAVDTETGGRIRRSIGLTGACIDNIGVVWINRNRADRVGEKSVRSELPPRSIGEGPVGTPDTSTRCANIKAAPAILGVVRFRRAGNATAGI